MQSSGFTYTVVEATNCWNMIYEILEEAGVEVKLAHTLKLKATAEAQIKTDKIDSNILAHLLRYNLIPACYVPIFCNQRNKTHNKAKILSC